LVIEKEREKERWWKDRKRGNEGSDGDERGVLME